MPWLPMASTLTLALLLLAASGFLNGTMQGDLPWAATRAEDAIYDSARYLGWGGVAIALVGGVAVAFISKRRSVTGLGWGWGIVTFVMCGFVGAVVFFLAYAVGDEHFPYVFSA